MDTLRGNLVLASPRLEDPNFRRTVSLMIEHNDEGAMGLVLNRPTETTVRQAWEQVSDLPCHCEAPLHQGGPCPGVLMALHTHESIAQVTVMPGLFMSTEKPYIEWLIDNNAESVRYFIGYAGWAPGQLEHELNVGSWMLASATREQILAPLGDNPVSLWTDLICATDATEGMLLTRPQLVPEDPSVN